MTILDMNSMTFNVGPLEQNTFATSNYKMLRRTSCNCGPQSETQAGRYIRCLEDTLFECSSLMWWVVGGECQRAGSWSGWADYPHENQCTTPKMSKDGFGRSDHLSVGYSDVWGWYWCWLALDSEVLSGGRMKRPVTRRRPGSLRRLWFWIETLHSCCSKPKILKMNLFLLDETCFLNVLVNISLELYLVRRFEDFLFF